MTTAKKESARVPLCANCYIPMLKQSGSYLCERCGLQHVIPTQSKSEPPFVYMHCPTDFDLIMADKSEYGMTNRPLPQSTIGVWDGVRIVETKK